MTDSPQPDSSPATDKVALAADDLRRAEAALHAERSPELIPIREANVAWYRYRLVCVATGPRTAQDIQAAIDTLEAVVKRTAPGSAAWFKTRVQLACMLVGSVSLVAIDSGAKLTADRLARATEIGKEIVAAPTRTPWEREQRELASVLATVTAEGSFQLLGHLQGLHSALALTDELPPLDRENFRAADTLLGLYVSRFETRGDAEDLERGIALGERLLSDLRASIPGGQMDPTARGVKLVLSILLGFRALDRSRASQHGVTGENSPASDCERAVKLARAVAEGPHDTPFDEAYAAHGLGMALRAQATVDRDPKRLGESILSFMRAIELAGIDGPAGRLWVNNAATSMGELARVLPGLRIGQRTTTVLDDAIALLWEVLERAAADPTRDPHQMLETKFNHAQLLLRRMVSGGRLSDDLPRARSAIADCVTCLVTGHRWRAPSLMVSAGLALQAFTLDANRGDLRSALEATLEAQALIESGAPAAPTNIEGVPHVLAEWRRHGGAETDILQGRIGAVRKLVDALPEYAAELANRRALEALDDGHTELAAEYAEIAVVASSRALVVADDPDLAYRLAQRWGGVSSTAPVAVAIAQQAPARAVMLLERAQANAISRLQLSLGAVESTAAQTQPAITRYLAARSGLRESIEARRQGRISATTEALRTADEELEASVREVRGLPGMSRFLVQITDFAQLQQWGAPCVYIAAGRSGGVALFVGPHSPPRAVPLPSLSEAAATAQVSSYLAALARFEREGKWGLRAFQDALDVSMSWLHEAVIGPIRTDLTGARWSLIPCGLLCNLPWSAVTAAHSLTYTPSVQICARAGQTVESRSSYLLVCESPGGEDELPEVEGFHAWIEHVAGERVTLLRGSDATPAAVLRAATSHEGVVFYAHGVIQQADPLSSGILLHGRSCLDVRTILANSHAFVGRTIILASCSQGHPDPRVPNQMLGPATAFLVAGARAVVAPGWPVEATAARIIASGVIEALRGGCGPGEALVFAQRRLQNAGSLGAGPLMAARPDSKRPTATDKERRADLRFTQPYFAGAFAAYGPVNGRT